MTRSDRLLVDTLRRDASAQLAAGNNPDRIRAELLAQIERSFGKVYAAPDLAHLLPGKLELAAWTLDGLLSAETASRN